MVAFWLFLTGLVRAVTAFRLRALGFRRWWRMLLNGLILAVCASLMAASPFVGGLSVAFMLGGTLVVSGVLILVEARGVFA